MKLKKHIDFINEARKQMSPEDKEALKVLNKQRSQLVGHQKGDDCPLGAPYGGTTVSDTRSGITSKSNRINNKYKTEVDWNKVLDKENKSKEVKQDMNKLYNIYYTAIAKTLTKEEKVEQELFVNKKYIESGKRGPNYHQIKSVFDKKLEEAGLKASYLKDIIRDKMEEMNISSLYKFATAMLAITKNDIEHIKKNKQFYSLYQHYQDLNVLQNLYGVL